MDDSSSDDPIGSSIAARLKKRKSKEAVDASQTAKKLKRLDEGAHETSTITIAQIPDSILVDIVKNYLPKSQWASLEAVDLKFRSVMFSVWRSMREVQFKEDFKFRRRRSLMDSITLLLKKLFVRSPQLKKIGGFPAFNGLSACQRARFFNVLVQFKQVRSINFNNWRMRTDCFVYFVDNSASRGSLKELIVDFLGDGAGHNSLQSPKHGEKEVLRLEKLMYPEQFFKTLYFVDYSNLTSLRTNGIRGVADLDRLCVIISNSDRLENIHNRVTCHLFREEEQRPELRDASKRLLGALANAKNLSKLQLDHYIGCACFSQELVSLIKECGRRQRLKALLLDNWLHWTTYTLNAIGEYLSGLQAFGLCLNDDISVPVIGKVIRAMSKLEHLNILLCCSTPDSFRQTMEAVSATHLKRLELYGTHTSDLALLARFENLEHLRIYGAWVGNFELKAWADGFGSKLKVLQCWVSSPDTFGLKVLLRKATGLRRLCFMRNTFVTDSLLELTASSCLLLREFEVWQRKDFTKRGVQALIDGCRRLKRLHILGTPLSWYKQCLKIEKYRVIDFDPKHRDSWFDGDDY